MVVQWLKNSMLPKQGTQVQSLIGKLRSHTLAMWPKRKKETKIWALNVLIAIGVSLIVGPLS